MKTRSCLLIAVAIGFLGCQCSEPIHKVYAPLADPADGSIEVISMKINGVDLEDELTVTANDQLQIEFKFKRIEPAKKGAAMWRIYAEKTRDEDYYLAGSAVNIDLNSVDLPVGTGELTFRTTLPMPSIDALDACEQIAGKYFFFALTEDEKIIVSRKVNFIY